MSNLILKVKERLQAGDTYLLKYNCPVCETERLDAYPLDVVECCKSDISGYELSIKHARLLVGTVRPGRIGKKLRMRVLGHHGEACFYCYESIKPGSTWHVEHIIPLCVGGGNQLSNLAASCPPCNLTAGAKYFAHPESKRDYILTQRNKKL